eukprot:6108483-Ditylum_brightwellii.AAC.1
MTSCSIRVSPMASSNVSSLVTPPAGRAIQCSTKGFAFCAELMEPAQYSLFARHELKQRI